MTVQDLTHLLPGGPIGSLTPTGMSAAGDLMTSNENACTAPGSPPAVCPCDPPPTMVAQSGPTDPVGDPNSTEPTSYTAPAARWGSVAHPTPHGG